MSKEIMELNQDTRQESSFEKLSRFVCHSTDQENIINIIKSRKLKSANLLNEEKVNVTPSRFYKKVDLEDTDFIEFAPLNSTIGEFVVNKRQEKEGIEEQQKYKPSVRIIFSKEKLERLPNSKVGELSIKIKDELNLDLADYIIFPSIELYRKVENSIKDEDLKRIISKKSIITTELESSDIDSYVNKSNILILDRL